jgi:hypothetical protein
MDDLGTLFGLLPEHWAAVVGAILTLLVAVRSVLRALVGALRLIDLALDGRYDWTWVGELSDGLDWLDRHVFDRLPVKVPFLKSKGG